MLGVYFSGTGNTRFCVKKLMGNLDGNAKILSIEDAAVIEEIKKNDFIVFGYPTQYSNAPKMVRDFIEENQGIWRGKKIFCLVTMGAFSGDGSGCSARLFKKYGADIVGGVHIVMPDSICDVSLLKKNEIGKEKIVREAEEKIKKVAKKMQGGNYPKDGLSVFSHVVGLLGQRLWFYGKTADYNKKVKISDVCSGCGLCAKQCPMKNIEIIDGKAVAHGKCTLCYRCVNHCPKQAVTILGKSVKEQWRIP